MNVAIPSITGRLLSVLLLIPCLTLSVSLVACGFSPDDDDSDPTLLDQVPEGALVITEVLANPNVSRPEFVEIQNASEATLTLQGCQVADGGASAHEFVLNVPVTLEPGQRALLSGDEYLGATEGEIVPDVVWDGVVLNQGDETESFTISCPDGIGGRQMIDTVTFDWSGLGIARGRSWQLAVDADAIANDDPANWCAAPAQDDAIYAEVDGVPDYGSPGAATNCESLGGIAPSVAGEVVISEILIHEFTGLREWFELHNPGTEAVDIRNCVITDEAPGGTSDPNTHTIDYEAGSTVIEAGDFLVLSRTETDITPDGSVVADYAYSGSLQFTNTTLQRLSLECPVEDTLVRIDEVTYDWSDQESLYQGHTRSLSSAALNSESNDDPDNWCVGSLSYYSVITDDVPPETLTAYGTPGAANPTCPEPGPYPAIGELVITELLVADFTGLREWIEVHNPGTTELDLFGCELVDVPVADALLPESQNRHRITPEGGTTRVLPQGYLLLSKTATDITSGGAGTDVVAHYAYSSVTLNNDDDQYLWLECPGDNGVNEIDRVEYNWGNYSANDRGSSIALDSSTYTAAGNDDAANWCLGTDLYYSVTSSDAPPVVSEAKGTPGTVNATCP